MKTFDFNSMTENEILILAKNGNTSAVDFILDKYKNFVITKTRTYFLIGAEKSDIIQEGMIGLYKAIKDYDMDGGSSFRTFADLCITRQIITAVKTAARLKHLPLNTYISLNKNADDDSDHTLLDSLPEVMHPDPEEILIKREHLITIEQRLKDLLSKYEIDVLMCYISGKSYSEMSKELCKSEKSIDNALQRIKKKLQKLKCANEV